MTTSTPAETVDISTGNDVVRVRQVVRALAQQVHLSLVDQTKLVTAASELARNVLVHGGSGSATAEIVLAAPRSGVRVRFADSGPGIADLALAMTDGYSSGVGLGLGLGGSKRLVDEFDVVSAPGEGTVVTVVKWAR